MQGSQSVESPCQAVDLPVSHKKRDGKPDSSAPPVDPPLELNSASGDVIKEGEECVSEGLHILEEKQSTIEDNTMDLLKPADVKSSGPALKTDGTVTNHTVTLFKGGPIHLPPEAQVSVQRRGFVMKL